MSQSVTGVFSKFQKPNLGAYLENVLARPVTFLPFRRPVLISKGRQSWRFLIVATAAPA
jgi:hypothetical protein